MIEKILDILKMILEKYLYKAFSSLAIAIIIFAIYSENFFLIGLSKTESIVLIFMICFCFFGSIEFFFRYIMKKKKARIDRKALDQEQNKYFKDNLKDIKNTILNLPPCDKEILHKIVEEGNEVRSLKQIDYCGELLRSDNMLFGNMLYASVETNPFSEWIEIVKKYSDDDGYTYVDYKLDDDFFKTLLAVQEMYGNRCFECK